MAERVKVIIYEELIREGELENFLKYSGCEVTVYIPDKQPDIETLSNAQRKWGKEKRVSIIRVRQFPTVVDLYSHELLFFPSRFLQDARKMAEIHPTNKFFVHSGQDLEFENEGNLIVCTWQYFSEYIRERLKLRPKKGKGSKGGSRRSKKEPEVTPGPDSWINDEKETEQNVRYDQPPESDEPPPWSDEPPF